MISRSTVIQPVSVALIAGVVSLIAGLLAGVSVELGVIVIAGLVGIVVLSLSPSIAHSIVVLCGVSGFLIAIQFGSVSGVALLTIALAGIGTVAALIITSTGSPVKLRRLAPFMLLAIWGIVSLGVWYTPTVNGIQNILVLVAFIGIIIVSGYYSRTIPDYPDSIGKALGIATLFAIVIFLAGNFTSALSSYFGLGPRGFALFALLGVCWYASRWRYGSWSSLFIALAILGVIALSLSRLALVVGLILLAIAIVKPHGARDLLKIFGVGGFALIVAYFAAQRIEPLRERFFEGDLAIEIAGIQINAMGRTRLWEATLNSFYESPVIGNGVGSAQAMIEESFPGIGHPHSDYLRLLHDYGLIGMSLWVIGFVGLLRFTWAAWQRADQTGSPMAQLHMANFLGLLALGFGMATDNSFVYIFVMVPLGVLLGASLANGEPEMTTSDASKPDAVTNKTTNLTGVKQLAVPQ